MNKGKVEASEKINIVAFNLSEDETVNLEISTSIIDQLSKDTKAVINSLSKSTSEDFRETKYGPLIFFIHKRKHYKMQYDRKDGDSQTLVAFGVYPKHDNRVLMHESPDLNRMKHGFSNMIYMHKLGSGKTMRELSIELDRNKSTLRKMFAHSKNFTLELFFGSLDILSEDEKIAKYLKSLTDTVGD